MRPWRGDRVLDVTLKAQSTKRRWINNRYSNQAGGDGLEQTP